MGKEPGVSCTNKDIKVHYYCIRERIATGDIDLLHVGTNEQVADIFTKAMGLC